MKQADFQYTPTGANALRILPVLFFTLVLGGCFPYPGLPGKAPEIEELRPEGLLSGETSIEIRFSHPMDRASLDSALQFSCEKGAVEGTIHWPSSDRLLFSPAAVDPPMHYYLVIDASARSIEGVPMKDSFSRIFTTTDQNDPLELLEVSPDFQNGEIVGKPPEIRFLFSQAVERESFYRAFSLTPKIEGGYLWGEENREVTFSPALPTETETVFHMRLSTECTGTSGLPLEKTYQWFFTVTPAPEPQVQTILFHSALESRTENVEPEKYYPFDRDEWIELIFDDLAGTGEPELHTEFLPALDFNAAPNEQGDGFVIHFEEAPEGGKEYLLRIFDMELLLYCDGPRSRPLEMTGAALCNDTELPDPAFHRIFPNDFIHLTTSDSACLEIVFSHGEGAVLSPLRLMEHLSLSFTNGSALYSPVSLITAETPLCPELTSPENGTVVRYFFTVDPQGVPGLMRIDLSGNLEDSFGNSLGKPIVLSYNL